MTPGQVVSLTILLAFVVFFGGPLLWLVLATTRSGDLDLANHAFSFGSIGNVVHAFDHLGKYSLDMHWQLAYWALNSLIYASASVAIICATSIPAGYALAVYRFPGRKVLLAMTLVSMTMPLAALVLPQFIELYKLHLLNTRLGVILPLSFYPFGAFLAYVNFSSSVSRDLLGAARIDGCREFQVFSKIAAPLSKGVIAVIAFFSFVATWNNYFLPAVVLSQNSLYPLPVGLVQVTSTSFAMTPLGGGTANLYNIHKPEIALATLLTILPVMILFFFSQRFVREGMLVGARKG
jgi:multiple sugar transport system permease protein